MSNENIEKQRKAIKTLIENQLNVLKLNGSTNGNKEVTISLPKAECISQDILKNILTEVFGYEPKILFCQELKCIESTKVVILTLLLK